MRLILFIFLGASFGSFLGLVIDRFPEQSIITPASHCQHCKRQLQIQDLLPIVSQILNRFRCRYCSTHIPYWYLLIEALSALFVVLYAYHILSITQVILLFAGLVLTIYDIKHQEYPFMVWLVFTVTCLLFSQLNWVFCILLFLAFVTEKWQLNIGSGDFLYLASLSLVLNVSQILWTIQISSLLGLLVFFVFKSKSLPYIPFLYLASLFTQLFM